MKNSKKKPFFATFLERQVQDPEKVKGGAVTSVQLDNVTNALKDGVTSALTDTVTKPGSDHVTMKYPSDGDDDSNAV